VLHTLNKKITNKDSATLNALFPFSDATKEFIELDTALNTALKLPNSIDNPPITSIATAVKINCLHPTWLMKKGMWVPCGKCKLCIKKKAFFWMVRIRHEMEYHKDNSFLTLTYAPKSLPPGSELDPKELTDFMKRFRYRTSSKRIRYVKKGEYGEAQGERKGYNPHYHLILFGISASETDHIISKTWKHGQTYMQPIEKNIKGKNAVAAYVAGYLFKEATSSIKVKQPPFMRASTGCKGEGGIGYQWIRDHKEEFRKNNGKFSFDGKEISGPSYYFKKAFTAEERREHHNEHIVDTGIKVLQEMSVRKVTFWELVKEHRNRLNEKAQEFDERIRKRKRPKLHYASPTNWISKYFLDDAQAYSIERDLEENISTKFFKDTHSTIQTTLEHTNSPTNLSPPPQVIHKKAS
jgi:hypothetical protein